MEMTVKNQLKWPGGKQAAVMITVELDNEFFWLGIDPTNIDRPKTLSMGTYGLLRGLDRVLDALGAYGIKATFFVPGRVAELYPAEVKKVISRDHELALHGYEHENFGLLTSDLQREAIQKGILALRNLTDKDPAGFRLPEGNMTPETLDIIQRSGFQYDSSMLDSDMPYHVAIRGELTGMVEIPMHWELQDLPYFGFNFHPPFPAGVTRIANYSDVYDIWADEFDGYYEYGLCYVIKFDPQSIGTPGRIPLLDKLLAYISSKNVWIAAGSEIASYYSKVSGKDATV